MEGRDFGDEAARDELAIKNGGDGENGLETKKVAHGNTSNASYN